LLKWSLRKAGIDQSFCLSLDISRWFTTWNNSSRKLEYLTQYSQTIR
jgi:hypothetical protein